MDPSENFNSLAKSVGLDVRIQKAVQRLGHVRPTLVQAKCLPLAMNSGRDLLVRAKTGSGKTLAYCLPLLQKVLQAKKASATASDGCVRGVILVPTRELCAQVHKTLQQLIYYCDDVLSVAVLSATRGKSDKAQQELARQRAVLRDRPDVIVASPSGLLTHIQNGDLSLKTSVETLVVDEADLVMSFGYADDVSEIIKSLPKIYQGFLMSATLSPELNSLKKVVLHSPVVLKLEREEKTEEGRLTQFYLQVPKTDKKLVVYVFLKLGLLKGKGIFFVNTTDGGYRLKLFLEQFHIRSSVLNAELPFRSRMNIIEQFNIGNFDYLIATDESTDNVDSDDDDDDDDDGENKPEKVKGKKKDEEYGVSRGLDFRNVSFVVNVDFPPTSTSYSHRVGRTARGGAKGVALSFVESDSHAEHDTLVAIQEDQPKVSLEHSTAGVLQSATSENMEAELTEQPQPTPLDFDLREVEGFRYRVEDVSRAVTRTAIKETRAAELRSEILNSERLQSHFEENPADLQILRHDRVATHISKVQEHLKHVPKYLLPRGMQPANLNKKRKRKRNKGNPGGLKRSDNDPLQTFDGEVNLEGLGEGGDGEDEMEMPDFTPGEGGDKQQALEDNSSKLFANTKDGLGQSTAGRNTWKEKHRKGKFSSKKRKSERKIKQPLGI